jgi:hypothetical protein
MAEGITSLPLSSIFAVCLPKNPVISVQFLECCKIKNFFPLSSIIFHIFPQFFQHVGYTLCTEEAVVIFYVYLPQKYEDEEAIYIDYRPLCGSSMRKPAAGSEGGS